ncbi:MAG: DNA cytosine methyltransferase [Alphaproteobacteria bacterium]|nr:DNA cytosine methyltransferase [Alphaproteobacteria bacterium]
MTEIAFIDLFSGIGGFAEGFRRAGLTFKFHAFSEIDKNAINIYKKHFPNAQGVGDVRTIRSFSKFKNEWGGAVGCHFRIPLPGFVGCWQTARS